jgi:diguanylate cyclase (GGDEF)-like protein
MTRMIRYAILLAFMACLAARALASPASPLHFNRIASFGYHSTSALLQDRQGFIWIATLEDGLYRYDGFRAVRYTSRPGDPRSLPHIRVLALYEDTKGVLWVGTRAGLARFNPLTNDFTQVAVPGQAGRQFEVRVIISDGGQGMWIAFRGAGVQHFDPATGRFTPYVHDPANPGSLASDDVNALVRDNRGGLWAATWPGGLDYLARGAKHFAHFRVDDSAHPNARRNIVRALMFDRGNRLWIGTEAGLMTWQDGSPWESRRLEQTPDVRISTLLEGPDGSVWAGSVAAGLLRWKPGASAPLEHVFRANDPYSLPGDDVRTVMLDRTGLLWAGTLGNGVAVADATREGFDRFIPFDIEANNRRPSTFLETIEGAPDRRLWLGSFGGGLSLFDPRQGSTVRAWRHEPGQPGALQSNVIYSLYQQPGGPLWIGTAAGLHRLDTPDSPFKVARFGHVAGDFINAIAPGSSQDLWLATGHGVIRYERDSGAFRFFVQDRKDADSLGMKDPTCILEDRRGRVWVGSERNGVGLDLLDPATGKVRHFRHNPGDPASLPHDAVTAIHEDTHGRLWVGTRNGLAELLTTAHGQVSFKRVTAGEGAQASILAIRSNRKNDIWVSSSEGLLRLDPATATVTRFRGQDGPTEAFRPGVAYADPDGVLYFGGSLGIVSVNPERVRSVSVPPPVAITDIRVFNRSLLEHRRPEGVMLDGPLTAPAALILPARASVFEIEYAALHFLDPGRNRYAHQLVGFDRDWVVTEAARRSASYTNLEPGDYVFRVRAANDQGVWNNEYLSFRVYVLPPLWQTWWFRFAALMLAAGALAGLYLARVRRLTNQKLELERLVQQRTAELEQSNRQLSALSTTDALTGVVNRRGFDEALALEWARAMRSGAEVSLLMIDVDHFKLYNDHYGHQAGDQCLRQVAAVIRAHARRAADVAARYGGEEFVLLVPGATAAQAHAFAVEIGAALSALRLPHLLSPHGVVTVSIGVAGLVPHQGLDPAQLVELADQAMYRAKEAGRNRAVLA